MTFLSQLNFTTGRGNIDRFSFIIVNDVVQMLAGYDGEPQSLQGKQEDDPGTENEELGQLWQDEVEVAPTMDAKVPENKMRFNANLKKITIRQ